ncbi:hypothetical protein ACFX15_018744 [Malus domestica]
MNELGVGSGDRGAIEWASLLRLEPRVDADDVEGLATEREKTKLVVELKFRQADRGEGEERKGGQGHWIDSTSGYLTRIGG